MEKLKFYRLRAKIVVEDLSDALGVMAVWDGTGASDYGLTYADPRLAELACGSCCRRSLPARRRPISAPP
ncbi:MAG: hypothetical protein WDN48_05395 [Pseudolabrys sp.]